MTSADLRALAKGNAHRMPKVVVALNWGADQADEAAMLTNWKATAEPQIAEKDETIGLQNAMVLKLTAAVIQLQGANAQQAQQIAALELEVTQLHATNTQLIMQHTSDAATIADVESENTQLEAANVKQAGTISNIAEQNAAFRTQISTLQSQLAAATISPLSLLMDGTALHGFPSKEAGEAFAVANKISLLAQVDATTFIWHPAGGA